VFQNTFNSKRGPIRIIQHAGFHIHADGNVLVERTFEDDPGDPPVPISLSPGLRVRQA
jgi:hypothetical protein